jgi:hypothetical protein
MAAQQTLLDWLLFEGDIVSETSMRVGKVMSSVSYLFLHIFPALGRRLHHDNITHEWEILAEHLCTANRRPKRSTVISNV